MIANNKKNNSKNSHARSNGRWTKTQHDRFMKGLERFGRDWVSVQKVVKTRNLTQVRSHAQKVFLKLTQKDIEALIANENQYQISKDKINPQMDQEPIINEQVYEIQKSKENVKKEGNLLDIFMQAIEQQSKDPSYQHQFTSLGEQFFTKSSIKNDEPDQNDRCNNQSQKQNIKNLNNYPERQKPCSFQSHQKNILVTSYPICLNLKEKKNIN